MFTFRSTTIAFFILVFALNIMEFSGVPVHYWYYILLVAAYLAVSFSMSFFIRSEYHMKALCFAETEEKVFAITFDDGPDREHTPLLLDVLKELNIPATFFCIGRKIKGNQDILHRMNAEGHLIGMHSFSHSNWFDFYSSRRMKKEFDQTSRLITEATGKNPLLFRPPYGVINPMVKSALNETDFYVIGFSNRVWDTSSRNENVVLERLKKKLKPGDVVLLHDTVASNTRIVKEFAEFAFQSGYTIVPLDQLLNINAYED
ncbi:MAG: polysaccharide deacetylase family protein [Bacteroidetes bacterium]|nr:polysaccharide deacetylase family protein [Bacteroidota bacterium]